MRNFARQSFIATSAILQGSFVRRAFSSRPGVKSLQVAYLKIPAHMQELYFNLAQNPQAYYSFPVLPRMAREQASALQQWLQDHARSGCKDSAIFCARLKIL